MKEILKTPQRSVSAAWGSDETPIESPFSFRMKQVHGNRIAVLEKPDQDCGEADGIYTTLENVSIGVFTADCVPLLLHRNDGSAIAALHAGWRGTASGIATELSKLLLSRGDHPENWTALIGPCAKECCYEVSEELVDQFKSIGALRGIRQEVADGRKLNLQKANRHLLESAGFSKIEANGECTMCARQANGRFRYFSYRRGDRDARQRSVIRIGKAL